MKASNRAYHRLREEILHGTLPGGQLLAEVDQAERLGVSRTPLREALARLEADGLVSSSGRGVIVVELSPQSVVELYELRQALETHAAGLAAIRRNPATFAALVEEFAGAADLLDHGKRGLTAYYSLIAELDRAIDGAIANSYFSTALGRVRLQSARVRRFGGRDIERLRAAAGEHRLIAQAIADGDATLASHATYVHLHLSRHHALTRLTSTEPWPHPHSVSPDDATPTTDDPDR